jgi:riboflavin kinase/FMN adenylyltransferase
MQVVTDGAPVPPSLRGGAIAIGNFDGVHRGHQAVIRQAIDWAHARGRPALVATFQPHPSRLFRPDAPPFALTSPGQKLEHVAALGADGAIVIPFTRELAALSPEAFVDQWLVGPAAPGHVVTGADFSFGHRRSGDAATLARFGTARNFTTTALAPVMDAGAPISSTRIRAALEGGDPAEAARLLSRPFAVAGEVIPGDQRGRTIGVPTANMTLGDYVRPAFGVYAVRARLPDGSVVPGVANLGIRPMFDPPRLLLETWLFDWSGDLYGQTLDVALIAFLRGEARFAGLDALKAAIDADARAARKILSA